MQHLLVENEKRKKKFMQLILEAKINFTKTNTTFCLSLHYDGVSYLFVNGKEIIKFKAKDSGIVADQLCLGNISDSFSYTNVERVGLYRSGYDFSVDYRAIAVDDIPDIQYKNRKEQYKIMLGFIKMFFHSNNVF